MVIGSTASRLLRKSRCPVLVVKNPCRGPYQRVLLPMDFSPGSALTIRLVRELAPQADLVLLHVFDVPFEGMLQYAGVSQDIIHQYRIEARERALQQLREMAAEQGLAAGDYTPLVEHGDAVALITGHQQRLGCDLVVMGKHGTHVTEELLLGSVTKRVLSEGDADVLVVVDKRGPQDAG
jgi:CPA2 family monovalent cation:H+ antiporter-2